MNVTIYPAMYVSYDFEKIHAILQPNYITTDQRELKQMDIHWLSVYDGWKWPAVTTGHDDFGIGR